MISPKGPDESRGPRFTKRNWPCLRCPEKLAAGSRSDKKRRYREQDEWLMRATKRVAGLTVTNNSCPYLYAPAPFPCPFVAFLLAVLVPSLCPLWVLALRLFPPQGPRSNSSSCRKKSGNSPRTNAPEFDGSAPKSDRLCRGPR